MALPRQVEEAERQAEELMKSLTSKEESSEETPDQTDEKEETPPAALGTPPVDENTQQEVDPVEEIRKLKAAQATLEGKYNAEVPRLNSELNDYRVRNAELMAELAEMRSRKAAEPPPAPEVEPAEIAKFKEEYPEISTHVDAFVQAQLKKMQKDFDKKVDTIRSEALTTKSDSFFDRLDLAVPDWKQLDTDADFVNWLGTTEKYARKTRKELLNEAVREGDLAGVTTFFNDYKAEKGTVTDPPAPAKKPIEKFASPGKSAGRGAPAASADEGFIKRSDVKDFYAKLNKGGFRGREKEAEAYEAKINAALAAGKIINA